MHPQPLTGVRRRRDVPFRTPPPRKNRVWCPPISDGQHFFRYDAWNRVVAIHAAGTIQVDPQTGLMSGSPGPTLKQYRHDALGRRVRTTDPSGVTRHVYGSGAEVLAEYAVDGTTETILREFVWGESFPDPLVLVDYTGAGGGTLGAPQRLYLLKDVQGSVGALTDSTGQVVERYTYTPYGQTQITAADGTTPRTESLYGNPFAYTAQRYEPQTGLYHFWARVYSPTLGRFLQEDAQGVLVTASIALGYQGGAPGVTPPVTGPADEYPDLLNLYAYAQGNPLRFTDPLGLDSWDEDIDDLLDDLTGHKIYALSQLNEGAKWASLGLRTAVDIALSLLPGYGIYEAYQSVQIIRSGSGGLMDYLTAGLGAASGGVTMLKAAKLIGKAAKWTRQGSKAGRTVLKYKPFNRSHFRHNLKVRTGVDPPSNVHAHHVLPGEFAEKFAAKGINHNDPKFGAWWPGAEHLGAHRHGYNDRWRKFLTSDPSPDEILQFGRRIGRENGLDIAF